MGKEREMENQITQYDCNAAQYIDSIDSNNTKVVSEYFMEIAGKIQCGNFIILSTHCTQTKQ